MISINTCSAFRTLSAVCDAPSPISCLMVSSALEHSGKSRIFSRMSKA